MSFPTDLDSLSNPTSTDTLASVDHAAQHANANNAIEALEAKVGVDGSAVTTSHDYKLSGVTGSDKAASKTGTETLTNKTLTSPKVNVGSDATGDMYYRDASGNLVRLPIGSTDQIATVAGGVPTWATNPTIANTPTTGEKAALVGTSGTPGSGNKYVTADDVSSAAASGKIVRATGTALPALSGANLTNLPNPAIYKNGTTTKDASEASTTQNIAHGLGTTPKYVRLTAYIARDTAPHLFANTVYNGTTQSSVSVYLGSGTSAQLVTTFAISNQGVTGNNSTGVITFDSTNISIAWTLNTNATGTYTILWEAFA